MPQRECMSPEKERQPAIRFEHISLSYGETTVLNDFCHTIPEGEFLTVIGSSGGGKTTMLKLVNGLLKADCGEVWVDGEAVSTCDQIALRRRIGYVIQEVGLFPHLNVEQNITFVPTLKGRQDKKALHARAVELCRTVGLPDTFLKRYPNELSGGQRQRVGIARALMASPNMILMDEPFGAVDEITRRALQDEIIRIHRELGGTILFITHDIKEALKLGDRVLVMDQGEIVQCAPPDEIRQHPASPFVAKLLEGCFC